MLFSKMPWPPSGSSEKSNLEVRLETLHRYSSQLGYFILKVLDFLVALISTYDYKKIIANITSSTKVFIFTFYKRSNQTV